VSERGEKRLRRATAHRVAVSAPIRSKNTAATHSEALRANDRRGDWLAWKRAVAATPGAPADPRGRERFERMLSRTPGSSRWRGPEIPPTPEVGWFDCEAPEVFENVGPAGEAPPAFDGMLSPTESARLANNRARARGCGHRAVEVEHAPCGSRYWIKFGCRSRLCGKCGHRYREGKRQRFEPLARLHVDGDDSSTFLRFLTLTWPDNIGTGPLPGRRVDGDHDEHVGAWRRERHWETPADANRWFRERTALIRRLLWEDAPENWGMRGYLAVWETTAERTCGRCGLQRSRHDRAGKGTASARDRRGKLVRGNECEGWVPGASTGRFHPHLHLLIYSRHVPIEQLRKIWESSGGGAQIRLEPAQGAEAVDYILKYLAKPWKGVPDDLQVVALYRTRRVTSVGEFYGRRFRQLSARLMESHEKTHVGIFCPVCNPLRDEFGPVAHYTLDGVELVDADTIESADRPVKRPPQWSTVRIHEPGVTPVRIVDAEPFAALIRIDIERAPIVEVAWNGVTLGPIPREVDKPPPMPPPEPDDGCPF